MRHRRRLKRPLPNPTDAHNGPLGSQVLHMRWLSVFRPLPTITLFPESSSIFFRDCSQWSVLSMRRIVTGWWKEKKDKKKLSWLSISASSLGYTQALSLFGRSQFLPLAELLTVHPPQRAAKTYARFSLFLSHFLLHFLSFLGRCDLLKSPYFSFTTEDNYYAPEENELTELEFSLKQSSKRKR